MTILCFFIIKMVVGTMYPIPLKKKVSKVEDLNLIKDYIERDTNLEKVGIANYQLIGRRKYKEEKE